MVADILDNAQFFLYDIEELTLNNVIERVEVDISLNKFGEILKETYYPDESKRVVIYDLPALFLPYFSFTDISGIPESTFCSALKATIHAKDSSGELNLNVTVYYSRKMVGGAVGDNVILNRYKTVATASGREEFFSFYATDGIQVRLGVAYLQNGMAKYTVKNFTTTGMLGPVCLRVSPKRVSLFAGIVEESILYYIVTSTTAAGASDQVKYVMDRRNYRRQTTFLYYNCFGLPETITMLGLQAEEPELESEIIRLLQREKQINVKLTDSRTVNSGYMQPDKYESLMDMLESPDIRLLEDGRNIPVVITDIDFSHQRIGNERISVSLTFRPAIRPSGRFVRTNPLKGRIFDQTFDYTFD